VPHPWSSVHTFGIDFPLIYSLNDAWKIHLIPTGQFSGEDGAKFGAALAYGGVVEVSHVFGPNLELGMGLAVYSNLATVSVYPYPIVETKISERFKFTNLSTPSVVNDRVPPPKKLIHTICISKQAVN
jgi:hypothetical protein